MPSGNDGSCILGGGNRLSGVRGHPRGGDNGPSRRPGAFPPPPSQVSTGHRGQRSSWPERRRSKVAGGARGYPHPCLATAPRVPATSGTQLRSLPQETRDTPAVPGPTAEEAAAAIAAAVDAAMALCTQGSESRLATPPPSASDRTANHETPFPGPCRGGASVHQEEPIRNHAAVVEGRGSLT